VIEVGGGLDKKYEGKSIAEIAKLLGTDDRTTFYRPKILSHTESVGYDWRRKRDSLDLTVLIPGNLLILLALRSGASCRVSALLPFFTQMGDSCHGFHRWRFSKTAATNCSATLPGSHDGISGAFSVRPLPTQRRSPYHTPPSLTNTLSAFRHRPNRPSDSPATAPLACWR
jgi:hypothetical protein